MKKPEFDQPFVSGLLFIAMFTILSMIFTHFLAHYYSYQTFKTPNFTSDKSQFSSEYSE